MAIQCNRVAKTIIRRALNEDMRKRGDITTRATVQTNQSGKARIISRATGVVSGQAVAAGVFEMLDKSINYECIVPDGEKVEPNTVVARIKGKMWVILAGERIALNIIGRCSGIASLTNEYVSEVIGTLAKITETRKTAPGLRYLDKAAVVSGGGVNHRYGLHDAFLIKENHITAIGGIKEAIEACQAFAEKHGRFRVMVEAENFDQYQLALEAKPDRILLDNMSPELIRKCVEARTGDTELEATGGITLSNVREYGTAGVDFISIGALTHSVEVLDLSLLVD
ncbi:MAG: carboxylating nicotinate-nucleotide diphosphorylase [Calditrichaeota bacterium]|nr:carboxylating nicotinate-nucleotide diphosphorylase [Calditrichota bacterium]